MRLPRPGDGQPVRVSVSESAGRQAWDRTFGTQRVVTSQTIRDGRMVERSGAGALVFEVRVVGESVVYKSVSATLFGISLPRAFAPRARGVVTPTADGWSVEVSIGSFAGVLCAYTAVLRWT